MTPFDVVALLINFLLVLIQGLSSNCLAAGTTHSCAAVRRRLQLDLRTVTSVIRTRFTYDLVLSCA